MIRSKITSPIVRSDSSDVVFKPSGVNVPSRSDRISKYEVLTHRGRDQLPRQERAGMLANGAL